MQWNYKQAVLFSRSFSHLSLTYSGLWTDRFIFKVISAFLFQIFWTIAVDVAEGWVLPLKLMVSHIKFHCKLYFGVSSWLGTSLLHVEIGLDARGFLYFEASARSSAHALPFAMKLLPIALLQKSGCLWLAGQISRSSHLCFLGSKFLYRESRCFQLPFQLELYCQSDGTGEGFWMLFCSSNIRQAEWRMDVSLSRHHGYGINDVPIIIFFRRISQSQQNTCRRSSKRWR